MIAPISVKKFVSGFSAASGFQGIRYLTGIVPDFPLFWYPKQWMPMRSPSRGFVHDFDEGYREDKVPAREGVVLIDRYRLIGHVAESQVTNPTIRHQP